MIVGIVGLPLSGKTTLFNALTGGSVAVDKFMGGKRETHRAVVDVPDERLERLAEIFQPRKVTPATVEYVDMAPVQREGGSRSGLDDEFLGYIRTLDELLIVLRAFEDESVPHPLGNVDPVRDLDELMAEFLLSDLAIVENRIARLEKTAHKTKNEEELFELELLSRFRTVLEENQPLRVLELAPEEEKVVRGYSFLTLKPTLIVVNIGESDLGKEQVWLDKFADVATVPNTRVTAVCAQIEAEIAQLEPEDARAFLDDLNLEEPARSRLIRDSYELLGLVNFFTAGEKEVRAWTIRRGTRAKEAAGAIHSDLERGFIRAEVVPYEDLVRLGSFARCREEGVLRLEGKDYVVQDGDVITVRFGV
ncbi:MAG: redox-regulated ATPase YchF [Calditrichaeota bacterium]|nr:redox-regulated ATPase YchF [Calditrichota bacterium]